MNRSEYETTICKQLLGAQLVPFKPVLLGADPPVIAKCHENVDVWVANNPTHHAVRGWVVYKQCIVGVLLGIELTAHSVVCDENGKLFDITPVSDERVRPSMRFVPHTGSDSLFFELEQSNRFICCPDCI